MVTKGEPVETVNNYTKYSQWRGVALCISGRKHRHQHPSGDETDRQDLHLGVGSREVRSRG